MESAELVLLQLRYISYRNRSLKLKLIKTDFNRHDLDFYRCSIFSYWAKYSCFFCQNYLPSINFIK